MGDYSQALDEIMLQNTIHGAFSRELINILRVGKIVRALRCSLLVVQGPELDAQNPRAHPKKLNEVLCM